MTVSPRVRKVVVFKHGVAYLERGGPADGPFELSFRRDEMNDVLKSLAIWVGSGNARVGGVSFEAPQDPGEALAERRLSLPEGSALEGLLGAMRGRAVRVHDAHGAVEGQVIGLDGAGRRSLLLRTEAGAVAVVELAQVGQVELLDPSARADLDYLLERTRAAQAGEVRRVRVSLTGRADDLRVAYVIPSPSWRMSYRLVCQPDATLLMGWAVVHNPADEDLDEVSLSLTNAQPVSFVLDLYRPQLLERAVVEAEQGTVASPSRPAGSAQARLAPDAADAPQPAEPPVRVATMVGGDETGDRVGMGTMILMAAAEAAPSPQASGEPFEYRVPGRVSIRRGSSALVPVIAATVATRRERVWREADGLHPSLVLAFANTTLSVLDEGPAVIYEGEGAYGGEAMLQSTPRGAEARLAYARDPSIRCRRATRQGSQLAGVRLSQGAVIEDLRREETHTFSAESDHPDETDVLFEIAREPQRVLDAQSAQPVDESATARRFRLRVPPAARAELVVVERWPDTRHLRYEQLTPRELTSWLEARLIDRGTHDALTGVLQAWSQARALDEQRARVEREQQEAFVRQQKLAEQLSVIKDGAAEAPLRQRYVRDMDREQERVAACEAEVRKLRDAAEQARKYAGQTLGVLITHAERGRR